MRKISESLHALDLQNLVREIFEIDSYASKMGEDTDIIVLSFTVEDREPASDLVNFIERGYDFVLDADLTPGELDDGRYKVFIEIERNRHAPKKIMEVLGGISKLTGIQQFRFRYYKSFRSFTANIDTLTEFIPKNKDDYLTHVREYGMSNFSNFFNRSYVESISVEDEDLVFQKLYSDPLRMRIKNAGPAHQIYESLPGKIMLEHQDMAEVLYLTKYLGPYNITKINHCYVFENQGYAVVLEKI